MADANVPGRTRPDQLEEVRVVTSRGKLESALLVVLAGIAVVSATTDLRATPRADSGGQSRYITRSPSYPIVSILSSYPNDIVPGFDNFEGFGLPEPPFIQQRTVPLVSVLTSYAAYNPGIDVVSKAFRRTPQFFDAPPFEKKAPSALITNLVIKPAPAGDLTTQIRKAVQFEDAKFFDKKNIGAWFVALQPQQAPLPPIPPVPLGGLWPPPATITNLPCRGAWELQSGVQALWVFGSGCYLMTVSTPASVDGLATFNMQKVGTLNTSTGRVCIRDNGPGGFACIVDGPNGYFYEVATQKFNRIVDPNFLGADRIAFIDGWWIFNQPGTQTFYTNVPQYSTTFNGTYFALKDAATDLLMTLFENKEQLWLIGEKTTEIWYDAGGQFFPFQRLVSTMLQVGCSAKHSIARFASQGSEGLIWLGKSERGECAVLKTDGFAAINVATPAIQNLIASFPVISDAIGDVYQEDGHEFYLLTFPTADKTLCYDGREDMWHVRGSYDPYAGEYHRHRASALLNFQNQRLVGDYQNGSVYQMTRNAYTDAGWPIRCVRRAPHVWDGGARQRVFQASLQIEFAPGVGNASGMGYDPQAILRMFSDGQWSHEYFLPVGKQGVTRNRAIKRRISFARDRVFEVVYIEPTPRDIVGVTLKAASE
jgi:hypothetical protein